MLGEDVTPGRAEGYDAVAERRPAGVGLGMPGADAEGIADALVSAYVQLRGSVPVGKT